jgi:subtilisin family serine protease
MEATWGTVSAVPNDPLLSQQGAVNNTHAEQAWNTTTGSPNIVVAVLDTGVDYDHPDLAENIWINQADIPDYWYTKTSATSGYDKIVDKSEIKTATPGVITMADLNNPANAGLVWKSDGDSLVDAGDLLRPVSEGGWEEPGKTNDLIGWNFVSNTNNPMDDNGHGTNVAGILGATGNDGTGVAGVDWNVQIMPVKWIGSDGNGSISNFVQALNYAVQHGAKITNNSWEGAPYSTALASAFQNAQAHGVINVVAAGNEGSNDDTTPDYPANLSTSLNSVVSVAATTSSNQLASFSNYGAHSVDLAAPGVNILSTLPGGQYGAMSGTSMATPQVSGAMALVWGQHLAGRPRHLIDYPRSTSRRRRPCSVSKRCRRSRGKCKPSRSLTCTAISAGTTMTADSPLSWPSSSMCKSISLPSGWMTSTRAWASASPSARRISCGRMPSCTSRSPVGNEAAPCRAMSK